MRVRPKCRWDDQCYLVLLAPSTIGPKPRPRCPSPTRRPRSIYRCVSMGLNGRPAEKLRKLYLQKRKVQQSRCSPPAKVSSTLSLAKWTWFPV